MKKIIKFLLGVLFLVLLIFFQTYFVDKPRQKKDDTQAQKVVLDRAVDGDTLILKINGERERVRLIGMDSPESVKPNSPVECFGKEASIHAKEILKDKKIEFVSDPSQDTRDRFGRLLGYLFFIENGNRINFAEKMIYDGYAYEYTYNKNHPYRYQLDFKNAQISADKNKRGLWAIENCLYKQKKR
jgi:micrococcal nuclease